MKDFYFTDRSWHLLGIATAGGGGKIHIVDDTDDQLISAGARTYSGTILFTPELSSKVQTMAARGNYILYMDERNKAVFMTIMELSHDPLAGEETFTAEDAGIDLINETVGPYKAPQAMGIADYINLFTNDSGFEIGLNEIPDLKRTLEWTGESDTTLNRILSVATQFDNAELDFSFDVSGTTVVRRLINIHQRIGADRNITLYVDKDINKIVTSGSIYDLYTAVTPTGGTPESKNGETADQQPITLQGYQWTDPDGRYVLTKEGVLLDPVANQTWSRLLAKGGAPSINAAYINRVVTYTATSQATLLQSALSDLKTHNHEAVNYETDIAVLPQNINIGDTIHLADENEQLYLSARLLELKSSYSMDTHTATLGDYLIEHDQVAAQYRQLAEQIKNIPKTIQYYPWLRYADDDQGTNMSALPAGKKYMAVVYSNKSSVPSDNPADYAGKWALIKGTDGADGVPGAKGADGRTSYFHTAWANDVSGQSGFTVSGGDGKKYIGTYSDFTQADSTNPADYNWALFKGEDGDVGPKGDEGLPGKPGADGRTAYAHFAYANSQDGKTDFSTTDSNRKYIGFYSDFSSGDSTNPSDYSWSLIKGADGANGKDGVPGKAGADGKTSYFHIAYADSSDGKTNFSLDTPGSRKYIGSYTDFTQADSTNPELYSWQLVQGPKGEDGADGVPGPKGADGKTSYFHTAYANSIDGKQGFSTTDGNGKSYFGQYVDQNQADSTDPTKYSWALFKGTDGRDGKDGSDNVPVITVGAAYPSGPKKGDMHWLTDSSGVVTGYYTYDGTKWNPYKIDAKILSAETFNGMTFNGVTFTGSKFISSFKGVKPDGVADYTVHGTTTMADGKIVTDTYSDTDNSQVTHTELSQFGLLSQIYNKGTLMDSAQLSLGMLTLSGNYQTASNKPLEWITSSLDALRVLQLTNNNLLVWHGAFYPQSGDTATISTPLSKTLSGWLIAWSYYQNGSPTYNNYAFTLLPKAALIYNTTGANYLRVTFTMKDVGTIFKVLWYDDTHIVGTAENNTGSLSKAVMTEVYAV
ncbi:phage tail protein [Lacticaseibacillus paracasei subsp. paracasei]|uniref:phage tail protein n=1 Tax=Lacticaseibacillus paracasei TaxID=1597 RepID=UPI001F1E4D79|nr:phage tail protein [Lacticaseibacillus paracasei]UJS06892.1 phage tail protein [Lacticaseibacillus paracasei subsp. paracasei]